MFRAPLLVCVMLLRVFLGHEVAVPQQTITRKESFEFLPLVPYESTLKNKYQELLKMLRISDVRS